jgi:beta-glucosidase-like glycosyl hydrolase/CubicO group peptidase (beta-lactamase class C family)
MRKIGFILWALTVFGVSHAQQEGRFAHWQDDKACMDWVTRTYDSLSLEERIAQCYMLAAHIDSLNEMLKIEELVRAGRAGGIIFFKGHPATQVYWTNRLQAVAKIPLLIGIDAEWGLGMRLDSVPVFPHQLTLGAVSDNGLIRQMGTEIGRECRRAGINVDFAPVVDINTNPKNPVINDRSFGEDKMKVSVKGVEYADGLQSMDVLACAKHFPGHGDTDKDSHKTLPTVLKTLDQLENFELYPFKAMIANGVGSMMVAHLNVPALDTTPDITTSLSRKVVTDLLKTQMGFQGLIFSDALNMRGVTSLYEKGTVDSIAFMAGTDILEYSEDPESGQAKILCAWEDSTLTDSTLELHVKKILAYKYMLGLRQWKPIDPNNLIYDLNTDSAEALRRILYEKAITIAANEENIIPIRDLGAKRTACISIDHKGMTDFQKSAFEFAEIDMFNAPNESNDTLLPLLDTVSTYQRVIVDLHGMSRLSATQFGINSNSLEFIQKLSQKTQVILLVFGSPYSLKYFDSVKNVIVAYEDNEATNLAVANILFGALPAQGHLPVSASQKYKAGIGTMTDQILRLKLASPEEVNMKSEDLREMDDIVLDGMIAHAYPGCQILVAKDGKVIWDKAYGTKMYENTKDKIHTTDLYDLASISKIAATTLAVMKLYDEKKIDLNKTVGDYLRLDDSATIKHLRISDIMTHQAGLRPFIPFYLPTIDTSKYACYYRATSNDTFCVRVCDSLCIRRDYPDTMWYIMSHSPVKPDAGYVYSDIDFYIMQKVVEQVSGMKLDQYVYDNIYRPMGLTRIGYKPLDRFDRGRIVPTERDTVFRKELVQGYVHDPGSAMYGGVAGHAGVFSDAMDLAELMQMLLNKGTYNGKQILSAETVSLFTSRATQKSRRGLGFDKPEPDPQKQSPTYSKVPLSVFGHTGFTGTSVWSDPDNNLTFIFLSNRVYPDAENPKLVKMNIRTDLQKVVYKALPKK